MNKEKETDQKNYEEDWLSKLLKAAIEKRASDIHLEPGRSKFKIRLRIDGALQDIESSDIKYYQQMSSKIKVESQMDIAKTRVPQDGHFVFNYDNHEYNIRVSTFPTVFGESIVLRILNRGNLLIDIEELGFDSEQLRQLLDLIYQPDGMILITGPSASGKTTLLNSCLNKLNSPENNIITIEDPVELYFEDIRQSQVNQYSEFNFASALRSILRQDPDIMMIGEIRDKETTQISIQAALTGRLILSTFHTFDVFSIVNRLMEMGVSRSVLAYSIKGLVSTRLVRKVCENCKQSYDLTEREKEYLPDDIKTVYRGEGCEECNNTGYYKRVGIFEIISFDEQIQRVIIEGAEHSKIREVLEEKRYKTIKESAIEKIREGITTPKEVFKILGKVK